MGSEKNYAGLFPRDFYQEIFHREAAGGGVGIEGVRFDGAAVALELGVQKILQLRDGRRTGRARAEANLLGDEVVGALAVEAAGFVGRRGVVGDLRDGGWRGGDRAHEGRLGGVGGAVGFAAGRKWKDG